MTGSHQSVRLIGPPPPPPPSPPCKCEHQMNTNIVLCRTPNRTVVLQGATTATLHHSRCSVKIQVSTGNAYRRFEATFAIIVCTVKIRVLLSSETSVCGVTSHNTCIFISIAVRIPNSTLIFCIYTFRWLLRKVQRNVSQKDEYRP